jgi:hypothetical protein
MKRKKMLTPESIKKYVNHPYNCPYCGDLMIEAIDRDYELEVISQKCRCLACEKVWVEIFKLVDIEEGFE